ncbi:MAG: ATP-binding cassette domain-containing protein [Candidatus Shapirobacteria bacterium]
MRIKFDQVNKDYGSISALKDFTLDVEPGEFIFIVGHSGAGKSTILKLILNQINPSSGEVMIDDIYLNNGKKEEIDHIRKKIGVIFQDYQLITDKTVEENIGICLDIVEFPKDQILSKIDDVIKKVDLQDRRNLFPAQLSGGELQRAALARALAVEPRIILADEPTGNLDMDNSWNLIKLLKDINENEKTTIIMTTHDMSIIDSLNKRVIKLENGEMMEDKKEIKTEKKAKKNISSKKE